MARASYSGRVQAGLVTFGIKAYAVFRATDEDTRLHRLHAECGERVKQHWHCANEKHGELATEDMVKGYEYAKDEYVVITDDDLKTIEPNTDEGRVFTLRQTCPRDQVDVLWIDKTYYVMPSDDLDRKAYGLFSRALREERLLAVVTFISHHKHHLAVIQPDKYGLMMHTLNFADTMVSLKEVGHMDSVSNLRANEITMARKLLGSFSEPFRYGSYQDEYRGKLQRLVTAKVNDKPLPQNRSAGMKPITDLMDALNRSLEQIKKKNGKKRK